MGDALHYATVRELGAALRARQTTPTELTRLYLERLDTVGRRLNAVVTLTEERALREAKQAEAELAAGYDRGPLHGIPYGAKDLLAAVGYPTSWGAAPFKDQVCDADAHVVAKLRDAGAVLVAKLAMIELAGGLGYRHPSASFTGAARVPWNETAWSGGSSSGSGSAVSSGAVGFAIGSETMGSVVHPSASSGISGLRPTYGRVSRRGAMALSWTMDKLGPMCRSADDCGLVLDVIATHDPADPTNTTRPYRYNPDAMRTRGFRVGVLDTATESVQAEVKENFEAALAALAEIGTLETVHLPDLPYWDTTISVIRAEVAASFDEFMSSGDARGLSDPADRVNGLETLSIPAHVYLRALRVRRHICTALDEVLARYDVIVAPTLPAVAGPAEVGMEAYTDLTGGYHWLAAANLAGLPGITVPNGFGERGLPTSLGFVGRAYDDNTVIAAARAYQARTDWHTRRPPV